MKIFVILLAICIALYAAKFTPNEVKKRYKNSDCHITCGYSQTDKDIVYLDQCIVHCDALYIMRNKTAHEDYQELLDYIHEIEQTVLFLYDERMREHANNNDNSNENYNDPSRGSDTPIPQIESSESTTEMVESTSIPYWRAVKDQTPRVPHRRFPMWTTGQIFNIRDTNVSTIGNQYNTQ